VVRRAQIHTSQVKSPATSAWRLMEMLERDPRPTFDLCYFDGAHNWDTDGFTFFLVDKLLNEGALLILDDMNRSYAKSP
jgi:hypothetical protein